jgi:hypothetical protein
VGIEEIRDKAKLEAFLEEGTPGERRCAVTEYELFGDNVMSGDKRCGRSPFFVEPLVRSPKASRACR